MKTKFNQCFSVIIGLVIGIIRITSAAGDFNTTGSTGFVFLNLPVGARFAAMGETGITLANIEADALFTNPALLARLSGNNSATMTFGNWYVDTRHSAVAYAHRFPMMGTVGIMLNYFDFGEMVKTRTIAPEEVAAQGAGENNIYYNLGSYHAGAFAVGAAYSRYLTKDFSFGALLKYVRETIDSYYADNYLVDIGFVYNTGIKSLRVGTFLKNFGLETEYEDETFKMPQRLILGISGEIYGSLNDPTYVTLLLEAVHPNDAAEHVHVGIESRIYNLLALRAGYKFGYEHENLSLGIGSRFLFKAKAFNFDLSYMNHTYLENTIRYSLSMEL